MKRRDRVILILLVVLIGVAGGVWVVVRMDTSERRASSDSRTPRLKDFEALPYLTHVENDAYPDQRGVTLYNDSLSFAGLNLLTSLEVGGAHLLDMNGEVLHSWNTCDSLGDRWLYSEMEPNGDLFVLITGLGLVKMDWESRVIWISRARDNPYLSGGRPGYHHDFGISTGGDIYILAKELRKVHMGGRNLSRRIKRRSELVREREIRDNSITTLASDGFARANVSLYDLVGETMAAEIQAYIDRCEKTARESGTVTICSDIFHSNTVEGIPRDIAVARKGDILFCIRNLDLIGILRLETGDLIWTWGPGILEYPHHPSVLESGNILVFDNGRRERSYSRILELDPATNEIVWRYEGEPRESFFSAVMGASQRLPNGNTLITESTSGRVFEVTPGGEITWQFLNFEVSKKGEGKGKRATIYRMIRYGPAYLERPVGGLKRLTAAAGQQ